MLFQLSEDLCVREIRVSPTYLITVCLHEHRLLPCNANFASVQALRILTAFCLCGPGPFVSLFLIRENAMLVVNDLLILN